MKIENNEIRISDRVSSTDLFKDLKQGSRLSVTIAERLGQRSAVLDINGRRVNAEFLQGVPDSGKLSLILEKKSGETLFFKIANSSVKEELTNELYKFTILTNGLNKLIYGLQPYLKEGINSIFALNKALLQLTGYTINGDTTDKTLNLVNKLLLKGARYEDLMLITALTNPLKGQTMQQIYYILSQILPDTYKDIFNVDKITERIADLTDFIDQSFDPKDKSEIIRYIFDLIKNYPKKEDTTYGEIIFFEEKKSKLCKYIINNNNILLSLNLSFLGNTDILIKQEKSHYFIAFYCERDESLNALKSENKILESSLNLFGGKNIHINYYNNKKAAEKIIEIISSINFNYLLDVKA